MNKSYKVQCIRLRIPALLASLQWAVVDMVTSKHFPSPQQRVPVPGDHSVQPAGHMYSNLGNKDGDMEKTEWEKLEHDNYIQKIMDLSRQDSKVHNKFLDAKHLY